MHFLEIFGQKNCIFGSKTVFLGQEVHHYMVYIAYFTELNFQICDNAQKRRICRQNCKYALDEKKLWHFLPPPKACQVLPPCAPVEITFKTILGMKMAIRDEKEMQLNEAGFAVQKLSVQKPNLPNLNTPWPPFMLSSRAPCLTPMIRSGTSPTVRTLACT